MAFELRKLNLNVDVQLGIPMNYEEIRFDAGFRLDLLVEGLVIVEIKSVESILAVHHKQLLTYLKMMDKKLGPLRT